MMRKNDEVNTGKYIEPDMEISIFTPEEVFTVTQSNDLPGDGWTVPCSLEGDMW